MTDDRDILFPPDPRRLGRLRAHVRAEARRLGAGAAVDALCLVVDELVGNALEHGAGYRRRGEPLRLRITASDGRLVLDFVDPEMPTALVAELAAALRRVARGAPPADGERGRGLFLIAIHLDELRVDLAPGGGLHLRGRLAAG